MCNQTFPNRVLEFWVSWVTGASHLLIDVLVYLSRRQPVPHRLSDFADSGDSPRLIPVSSLSLTLKHSGCSGF
ncbi:hypothetical protein CHARACLAT_000397 [Characodon lateralis]|uniref:Uncharacterized protein n=1 Tax=Characodon lateralis TaxID=208331 RepID=A0ABU7DG21_9TELE|nr:hypothetical protein [Characodon lateralis]